jgi:KDO2-lipid IV(A) lauroyltransferase
MRFIGFVFVYSLLWLLHLVPEKILKLFSCLLYLLMYHVARYRKKVVSDNLHLAFPERNSSEIRLIARKFYRHLSDLILEEAIAHFDSDKQYLQRMRYLNPELLHDLFKKGKQVIAVTAHYGNWEFLTSLGVATQYKILGAYKPLKNKYFDRIVRQNRERCNAVPVPMEKIVRVMIQYHRDKIPALTVFLADQRPVFRNIQYWTKFLGQDTPVYLGPEKLAGKLDAAVVFMKIRKLRFGRYEAQAELICEDPGKLKPFEITESHVRILERMIREAPEFWLWSHRRWKHSYERYLKEKGEQEPSAEF